MNTQVILGTLFLSLSKTYIALVSDKLQHLDIKRHYYALLILHYSKEPMTQTELAERMSVDKVAIVRLADYLETKGYIRRKTNAKDRRQHFLELMPKANKVMPKIIDAFKTADESLLSMLDETERKYFLEISRKIGTWFESNPINHIRINVNYSRIKG